RDLRPLELAQLLGGRGRLHPCGLGFLVAFFCGLLFFFVRFFVRVFLCVVFSFVGFVLRVDRFLASRGGELLRLRARLRGGTLRFLRGTGGGAADPARQKVAGGRDVFAQPFTPRRHPLQRALSHFHRPSGKRRGEQSRHSEEPEHG